MSEFLPASSDEFETPYEIFDELNREFVFTLDAAASDENYKMAPYCTKERSALNAYWDRHRVFCNPPYSRGNVKAFAEKAFYETSKEGDCPIAVLLIPTYTERDWFHRMRNSGRVDVRFFKKRIKFIGGKDGARGNHMLMIFRRENDFW